MFEIIKILAIANSENDVPGLLSGNVNDLILSIVTYAIGIAGLVAIVFIVYGGFQYITAAGNDESASKGAKTITYAVIGLLLVFASYAIVNSIFTNVLPF